MAVAGIVLAVIALFYLPVVSGSAGAVLGLAAYRMGDRTVGRVALIAAPVGVVLGTVFAVVSNLLAASG